MTTKQLANSSTEVSDWVHRSFYILSKVKKMTPAELESSVIKTPSSPSLRLNSWSPELQVYLPDLNMTKLEFDHRFELHTALMSFSVLDLQALLQDHLHKAESLKERISNCKDENATCNFEANWLIIEEVSKAILSKE